jgi:hypothetical protein
MFGFGGIPGFSEAPFQGSRETVIRLQERAKISRQRGQVFQAMARAAIGFETEKLRWISHVVRAVTIDTVHDRLCAPYLRVAASGVQGLLIRMAAAAETRNPRGGGRSIKTGVGDLDRWCFRITAVAA